MQIARYTLPAFTFVMWYLNLSPLLLKAGNMNTHLILYISLIALFFQLVPNHQSCGGVCGDNSQSYTATVINAAKVCPDISYIIIMFALCYSNRSVSTAITHVCILGHIKGLITWAGLVSVCRDLGTFVKRHKNQLRDYMTTGLARLAKILVSRCWDPG